MADACSASLHAALGVLEYLMDAGRVDVLEYPVLGACQAIVYLGE